MDQETKNNLYNAARQHVTFVQGKIGTAIEKISELINRKMSVAKVEDQWTNAQVKMMNQQRKEQLVQLETSPYFSKCLVQFDDSKEQSEMYFGKFSFSDEKIYSWIAPAGSIRFETPGAFSYKLPNGKVRSGTMHRKDQYMIQDGKIVFYSTESINAPRELVHQEHFARHKAGFVLPEIVSQMEKAQDTVIRAHYKGPFLISGPAGSGKTTLALHRIAYLIQSPETTELFPTYSILVVVQDESTKDYFSQLLPSLGINDVKITTFTEWAAMVIGLEDFKYESQFIEDDSYEYKKVQALRGVELPRYSKNVFAVLEKVYASYFDDKDKHYFAQQKEQKILDRIDMTLLLKSFKLTHKKLFTKRTYYGIDNNGDLVMRSATTPLEYSLIAVDEFQNYLPEQITLFKQCSTSTTDSMMYIGDMRQQIRVGTIKDWKEIGEYIPSDRQAVLNKVYRNTRQILEYIQSIGFNTEIPEGAKEGVPVQKQTFDSINKVSSYIEELLASTHQSQTVGVIVKSEDEINNLKHVLPHDQRLHTLSYRQSQGLEFDKVVLIGDMQTTIKPTDSRNLYEIEKSKIENDLLYVALTRAISELHIVKLS